MYADISKPSNCCHPSPEHGLPQIRPGSNRIDSFASEDPELHSIPVNSSTDKTAILISLLPDINDHRHPLVKIPLYPEWFVEHTMCARPERLRYFHGQYQLQA
jgi:hypothetical protein